MLHHSRPQRPRSFWSAPRIATSGQFQRRKSAIHGLPVTRRMFRVKFEKSDWFWSQSIVFTKAFKNGMPLDEARGRDSWCWPKGARPLGTRMRVTFATSPIRVQKPYPIYEQTGQNQLKLILRLLVLFLPDSYAMMMRPNKAETAVHGCHCPGDMAGRMRKVLARPWVGVRVCHLLLKLISYTLRAAHTTYLYSPYKGVPPPPPGRSLNQP